MTTEATSRAPTREAGFRLLTQHLPDLALVAFDPDLRIWSATGAALQARGWGPEEFLGKRVPSAGPRWPASAAGSRRPGGRTRTRSGRSCSCPCPTSGAPWSAA